MPGRGRGHKSPGRRRHLLRMAAAARRPPPPPRAGPGPVMMVMMMMMVLTFFCGMRVEQSPCNVTVWVARSVWAPRGVQAPRAENESTTTLGHSKIIQQMGPLSCWSWSCSAPSLLRFQTSRPAGTPHQTRPVTQKSCQSWRTKNFPPHHQARSSCPPCCHACAS